MDDANFKRLDHLYDYTKFHIGMYVTLISAVFALVGLDFLEGCTLQIMKLPLTVGVIGLALAGGFGSLVASAIPMSNAATYEDFMKGKVGPIGRPLFPVKKAAYTEHVFFWIAVLVLLVGSIAVLFPDAAWLIWADTSSCFDTDVSCSNTVQFKCMVEG